MEKNEFLLEVNCSLNDEINSDDFSYEYISTFDTSMLGGQVVAVSGPDTGIVKITYKPTNISKEYKAGHDTTFPVAFIDDWKKGIFENK